jgi:hypothetical protein
MFRTDLEAYILYQETFSASLADLKIIIQKRAKSPESLRYAILPNLFLCCPGGPIPCLSVLTKKHSNDRVV